MDMPIPERHAITDPDQHRPALLLVDDEPNILTSLRRLLRQEGYVIHTADSGAEGLRVLEREVIDLVISDMRMPEMDGAVFLARVRERWPGVVRILLTGFADLQSTVAAVNRGHIYQYLSKPWEDHELRMAVHNGLERRRLEAERLQLLELTRHQNLELTALNGALEAKVRERTRALQDTLGLLGQAHEHLKHSFVASVKVFANMIEMREGRLAGHSRRVAATARELARQMGMQEEQAQQVLFAGLLHDIGKLRLSDEAINTPFNELNSEQRLAIIKHPVIGQGLLMSLEPLQETARLIRSHHERYDGLGYPDGLRGNAIPLGARILALANDFDAVQIGELTSCRLSMREAFRFIVENRGKRYDPAVVDAFSALYRERLKDGGEEDSAVAMGSRDLAVGMVVARDTVTGDGLVIITEGYVLDERIIRRIQRFEQALNQELVIHVRPGSVGA